MGRVGAVIPAAGVGARLGAGIPKAFVPLRGVTLLERAVAGLRDAGVETIVVVAGSDMVGQARALLPDVEVVVGGAERADSVFEGLKHLGNVWAAQAPVAADDVVLVHDAARALTPVEMIRRVMSIPEGVDGVIPVLPVTDTIKQVDDRLRVVGTPARAGLRAVQTPQAARLQFLLDANEAYAAQRDFEATDDASLIEWAGGVVACVEGDERALKITRPVDMVVAEHFLS